MIKVAQNTSQALVLVTKNILLRHSDVGECDECGSSRSGVQSGYRLCLHTSTSFYQEDNKSLVGLARSNKIVRPNCIGNPFLNRVSC